jgi:hypothetical protein
MTVAHADTSAAHAAGDAGMLAELVARAGELDAAAGLRAGTTATDAQLHRHAGLVDDELGRRGIVPGPRAWFTAQRVDGRICGRWARSWHEAVLVIGGAGLAWCVVDERLEAYGAYYPYGRRAGDRETFPVTPAPVTRAELVMLETPAGALF